MNLTLIPAIIMKKELAFFIRFDRAGALCLPPIHINREPRQFITVLAGFIQWPKSSRDTTILLTEDGGTSLCGPLSTHFQGPYHLTKTLHETSLVRGRCSRVFSAFDAQVPETTLVMKDWWRNAEGPDEGDMLRQVTGLFGLPEYVHHWVVNCNGSQQDTTLPVEDLVSCPYFSESKNLTREVRIHCRMFVKTVGSHLYTHRSSPRVVLSAIHDAILGESIYHFSYLPLLRMRLIHAEA